MPFLHTQTISMFGSIALTVNNISGPGMLEFPAIFQSAGWLPCLLVLVLICFISSICATMLCDTMARIKGNGAFERREEFSDIFKWWLNNEWFVVTQIAFFLCLLSQNVAAIVSTAQVIDSFVATFLFPSTVALQFYPKFGLVFWDEGECNSAEADEGSCIPFGDNPDSIVFTLGYVVCFACFFYLGLLNLDENILAQKISFIALLILTLEFIFCFFVNGLDASRVPVWGEDSSNCLGVIIFNFAFCVTVPSWINEKAPDVSVNKVIWSSTTSSTVLYAAVGWLGAMAFDAAPDNMLEVLESPKVGVPTRIAAALFGVFIIGLGIPIFCVLMRYNLEYCGVCSGRWSQFWGAIFPWTFSWLLYNGHGILELLSWTGLILNGFIDFIAPIYVSYFAAKAVWGTPFESWERYITVVSPLPTWLVPYQKNVTMAIGVVIVMTVGTGLVLKVQAAIAGTPP